jgi:hypothetical protein
MDPRAALDVVGKRKSLANQRLYNEDPRVADMISEGVS